MFKLPNNKKWYEQLALLEGEHEISAGYLNPELDGIPIHKEKAEISPRNSTTRNTQRKHNAHTEKKYAQIY